ncbi:MAG TPA: 16S rRNA (cytosine(967)-C(5))-methyltransferase RsmB [Solirubrobacteraceae bacterium]|nr:16S rRNA (cytosine(967)-C(5))-methyltransferase RsmB [Solirubrobacteraceae bacterium]
MSEHAQQGPKPNSARGGARGRAGGEPSRARRAPIAPARRCAYVVLCRVFEQDAYADRALQAEADKLDARDRALAMRLAYGSIQRRATLDHVIERLAERPPDKLDASVSAALRLGLYELLYLDGAPDRAVVADCVELAKTGKSSAHKLVNAVLRRATREGAGALLGDLREDTPEQAAIAHSHPLWLARLWWDELGPVDARALMAADNLPGELALRVNTLCAEPAAVAAELGVSTHTDPQLPEALVLDGPLDLHRSGLWQSGAILAQSRAAMLVSRVLDPRPGERVLDLCAAPGGKSTHIAALMGGEGEVVAVERNRARAAELIATARRLHADGIRVELADAATARPEGGVYDRVLIDPPCSGLGTLQARPDLRWRVSAQGVEQLARIQMAILDAGAQALRPGGVLVYSTCTISAPENEQQIELFLERTRNFALEDLRHEQRSHVHPHMPQALLTLPHRDRTAGFFIARMRRVG